mmetsp:Transcript_35871/g.58865  ORF Transcript_35871/g.58865 Transcript_35871/m.58865 type:complete len:239 (-) Transcript_35871:50-766(-)
MEISSATAMVEDDANETVIMCSSNDHEQTASRPSNCTVVASNICEQSSSVRGLTSVLSSSLRSIKSCEYVHDHHALMYLLPPTPTFTASTCTQDIRISSSVPGSGISGLTKISISWCSTSVPFTSHTHVNGAFAYVGVQNAISKVFATSSLTNSIVNGILSAPFGVVVNNSQYERSPPHNAFLPASNTVVDMSRLLSHSRLDTLPVAIAPVLQYGYMNTPNSVTSRIPLSMSNAYVTY